MGDPVRKLSVVISCFNEEGNIRRFPAEVFGPLAKLGFPCEFIFVDDGSQDGSASALDELKTHHPDVRIVRHDRNQGLGAGLRAGFSASTGDAVLTLDADLTFHPSESARLVNAYKTDVDIVMGSPFLGSLEGVSPVRKFLSQSVNFCYGILFGQRFTATSSIFRLYRSSVLKSLSLASRSFDINAEILFKALQKGAHVVEVPTTLTRRTWGESKIGIVREIKNHLKMFLRILRWRLS